MGHDFKFEVIPLEEVVENSVVSTGKERAVVLVVDDEPLIVESLGAILSSAGLAVLRAHNGASALELAMEQPPDQLLSDVAMPGMDGITLAMTVADTLPHCRVILFSGHASTRDLTAARAAGYDFPLLAKPIHPKEMLQRIFAALDGPAKHPHTRRNAGQHAVPVGLQTLQVTI